MEIIKKLIKELKHLLSYDIKDEMFFKEESEEIDEMSKYWVKTYEDKKEYHPHISLKCFEPSFDKEIFPIDFLASRIAICHLGRKGTCRKILFETKLKEV